MPQITELNDEEIISESEKDRIIRSTGIMDRLPPDFIPFDPTNTQPFVEGMRPSELLRRQAAAGRSQTAATTAASTAERGTGGLRAQQAWNTDSSEEEDDEEEESEAESDLSAATLMKQQIEQGMNPMVESVLDLIIWTMPFGFLYIMLDVMIQQQYAMHPSFLDEVGRVIGTVPFLAVFIWFTAIRTNWSYRSLQALLFVVSTIAGGAFLWIYAKAPFEEVVRRTPPLGTLWMYTIVKLDLPPTLVSLGLIYTFVTYNNLKLLQG